MTTLEMRLKEVFLIREYPGFVNGEFSSQVINQVKYGIVGGG